MQYSGMTCSVHVAVRGLSANAPQVERIATFLFVALFLSCHQKVAPLPTREEDVTPILEAMAAQERAWDGGDLEGFMQAYSDTVCFICPKGTTCGRQAVLDNYRRSYPDAERMGDLQFTIGEVLPLGSDHAWVTGGWALHREADTLSGGFSLLWMRTPTGWSIVRDHTH